MSFATFVRPLPQNEQTMLSTLTSPGTRVLLCSRMRLQAQWTYRDELSEIHVVQRRDVERDERGDDWADIIDMLTMYPNSDAG